MKLSSLIAVGLMTAWSVTAAAQQETQTPELQRDTQSPSQAETMEPGATPQVGNQRSAEKLIGMDIRNPAGESLGEIEDIILDNQQGRIAYAVVSHGGILGIGDKLIAVPWQAFMAEGDALTLDIDKERLKSAPSFDKGELPDQSDPAFHQQVHEFYGTEPYDVSQEPGLAESEQQDDLWEDQETQTAQQQEEEGWDWKFWTSRGDREDWARRLSEVIGTEVVGAENEKLGEIEDVAIDMREGRVTFALVSYGGIAGQTAAVPWNALQLNEQQQQYSLDATAETLDLARLEGGDISRLEDEQFSRNIHEAFGEEPYWIAYGYGDQEQEERFWSGEEQQQQMQTQPESRTPGQAEPQAGQQQMEGQQVALSGTVENVRDVQPAPGREPAVEVQLRTPAGETETIHLASRQPLERQNLDLSSGDQIQVEGIRKQKQGRSVVEATEISKQGRRATFEPRQTGALQQPEAQQRAEAQPERPESEQPAQVPAEPGEAAGEPEPQQPGQPQQMGQSPQFAEETVSFSGTIEAVEEFSLTPTEAERPGETRPLGEAEEEPMALHLQMQTEDGTTEILHISSPQALEDQNIDLTEGEDIQVEGYRTRFLGEPVIEVTQVTIDGQTIDLEPQARQPQPSESI